MSGVCSAYGGALDALTPALRIAQDTAEAALRGITGHWPFPPPDINKTERGERVSVRSRGRLEKEEKARHGGGCCSREQSLALPTTTPAPSTIQTNAFASGAGLFISATEREGTEE